MSKALLSRAVRICLALISLSAFAGDEFETPTIQSGTAYTSETPVYQAIGAAHNGIGRTLYVVADPASVLSQVKINRIIRDALRREPNLARIHFYTAVHDQPAFPAFAIYEHLGVYVLADNKTYYGVAAKYHYGGWAYGPVGGKR